VNNSNSCFSYIAFNPIGVTPQIHSMTRVPGLKQYLYASVGNAIQQCNMQPPFTCISIASVATGTMGIETGSLVPMVTETGMVGTCNMLQLHIHVLSCHSWAP
jgi:hypothetical protein